MKPKGLVAAASMTSQGSTPILRQAKASSLARAMLTLRKGFSRSLAVSATRGLEASDTLTGTCRERLAASSGQLRVMAPTTFGVFAGGNPRGAAGRPRGGHAQ